MIINLLRLNSTSILTLATLLSLLQSQLTVAQDPQDPDHIIEKLSSVDIAGPYITEALRNNPSLSTAEQRYEAARASIPATAGLPNPTVQLTHFVESIQTRTGPQRQALMLQQPLPWLGKLDRKRTAARARSQSLWHAYLSQQFKVVDEVSEQVLELAYLDKAIAASEKNLTLFQRLENVVENRVRGGGELADLLRVQVEIEKVHDTIDRLKAKRTIANALLDTSLGREPIDTSRTIAWTAPEPVKSDDELWYKALVQHSPNLAMLRSLTESEAARNELSQLANRPDFSIGLNYIRTGDALNQDTPDSGRDPWAIMVGVSLPIWGKSNNAVQQQAALELEALETQIEEERLNLLGKAATQITLLRDAEKRIQRYDTNLLPLARQTREITQKSYESGKSPLLDLIESERVLFELETLYWRAAADAWQARWKLATLSGGLWLE